MIYAGVMPTIQLRRVPEDLHKLLKARAAEERVSLSEYLRRQFRLMAEVPTAEELQQRERTVPG